MPPKQLATPSFSSSDFLSKSQTKTPSKKRKISDVSKKSKKVVVDDETRGHMTIFSKSKASVEKDFKEKKEKKEDTQEPTAATKSLSVSIKEGETLLVIDGDVVVSHLLTEQEQKQLDVKKQQMKKKYGEEPSIFKLQWHDRDGATLVGISVSKKTTFEIVSKLTEAQSFSVDSSVWLASRESIGSIAINEVNGKKDILAVVPDYKGVVRVTLDNEANGTFGLAMTVNE